jgi:two-component system capsular synthesis sensor histidine kinase RcsC
MAGHLILLVDDDESVLESLQLLVGEIGYRSETAAGGAEALQKLEVGLFDAVITDLRMPGMDGFDLAREIRKRWATLPVIVVTGNIPPPKPPEVTLLLQKPFSLRELDEAMSRVLPA